MKKKKYRNILFVCTGNICRSVIGEQLLKKEVKAKGLTGIKISSAGIAANPEYRIYGDLKDIMEEEGIFPPSHISTQLTEEMVKRADLILVMENKHMEFIRENFSDVDGKLFILKEFAGEKGNLEIEDPIGKPPPAHRQTLEEIRRYIKKVFSLLK